MVARWMENRKITKRIVITGTLTLLTPARFGSGDSKTETLTDMPLLRDPKDGTPLLPGASIAGSLRAYLREWELGYEKSEPNNGRSRTQQLFGDVLEDYGESRESYLIIEDSISKTLRSEFRPGVKIDAKTRTASIEAAGGQLYDMELLEAGTEFPLCFELALPDIENKGQALREGLAIALTGFERKEIGLGARKRRGFGECQVTNWQVQTYDLTESKQLVAWIGNESGVISSGSGIAEMLEVKTLPPDHRKRFYLDAIFKLESSLLIRSGGDSSGLPDMVHLKSRRMDQEIPVLSGTSLAGTIRSRALRIANTMTQDKATVINLVEDIFGPGEIREKTKRKGDEKPKASHITVREREVTNGYERVQTRIRIDPFSGGTYPGALFEQQPIIGGKNTKIAVSIELRQPEDAHIGLLLHIIKDLWTGDIPLGGEASVGRGRLKGLQADLQLYKPQQDKPEKWRISSKNEDKLHVEGNCELLEKFSKAFGDLMEANDEA
jgi:CRISPR/Cas system CSM-associated protein Csm3 (group 7 of RAMP superfamily)